MTRDEVFAKLKVKIVEGLGVEEENIEYDPKYDELIQDIQRLEDNNANLIIDATVSSNKNHYKYSY